jgi:phosphoribosylglycinamide formyltransferase-1
MRVVGLMSGSGTNIRKILDHQRGLEIREGSSPFRVVALFSDRAESQATRIGRDYDLPVAVRDLLGYCTRRGVSRRDLEAREGFDEETVRALSPFEATVAAYGGYMSIATRPLMEAFLGINVHPADLAIQNPDGSRKYVGDHAVRDAIAAGEGEIRSSTHIVEPVVDGGRILMISAPVGVVLEKGWNSRIPEHLARAEEVNQERLKEGGDWRIFPRTIEDMARGRFAQDEHGRLHYGGNPIPYGYRLDG